MKKKKINFINTFFCFYNKKFFKEIYLIFLKNFISLTINLVLKKKLKTF